MFSTLRNVSILAKGRYSEIYKYIDTKTLEFFVIKKHPKVVLGYKKECNTRELEVYNKIYHDESFLHPNIIKYFGYTEDEDDGYFKLEYINGYDLNRIINESKTNKKEKYISKENIIFYLLQVINGLEFLHSKGIYHCDIKPENILIYKNIVKIVDFGSGIISEKKIINTKDEDFLGTPGYLPKEIADYKYQGNVDLEYIDLFGLGSTIYFCFAKRVAFPGDLRLDISNKVKNMNVNYELIKEENIREIVKNIFDKKDQVNLKKVKMALLEVKETFKENDASLDDK